MLARLKQSMFARRLNNSKALQARSIKHTQVRRKMLFEAMEQRFLLSADIGVSVQEQFDNAAVLPEAPALVELDTQYQSSETQSAEILEGQVESDSEITGQEENTDSTDADVVVTDEQQTDTDAGSQLSAQAYYLASQFSTLEIVIVDPSVQDYEALIAGITQQQDDADVLEQQNPESSSIENATTDHVDDAGEQTESTDNEIEYLDLSSDNSDENNQSEKQVKVFVLDADRDGIEQINEILSQYQGISAVHILSHGAAGFIRVGNTLLNNSKLEQYSSQIGKWGKSLKSDGDILLYGCNVAEGEAGIEFIENLGNLTGADVAASTDNTGGSALGGDWDLEASAGVIESSVLFQGTVAENYGYLLDSFDLNGAGTIHTGTTGVDTFTAADDWGVDDVVDGLGDIDTLDLSAVTTNLDFNFVSLSILTVTDDAATPNTVDASNVEAFISGSGTNTVDLSSIGDNLTISLKADGSTTISDGVTTITLSDVEAFIGGSGTNTVDLSAIGDDLTVTLGVDGSVAITDSTTAATLLTLSSVDSVIGGSGANDTLAVGAGSITSLEYSSGSAFMLNGNSVSISQIENISTPVHDALSSSTTGALMTGLEGFANFNEQLSAYAELSLGLPFLANSTMGELSSPDVVLGKLNSDLQDYLTDTNPTASAVDILDFINAWQPGTVQLVIGVNDDGVDQTDDFTISNAGNATIVYAAADSSYRIQGLDLTFTRQANIEVDPGVETSNLNIHFDSAGGVAAVVDVTTLLDISIALTNTQTTNDFLVAINNMDVDVVADDGAGGAQTLADFGLTIGALGVDIANPLINLNASIAVNIDATERTVAALTALITNTTLDLGSTGTAQLTLPVSVSDIRADLVSEWDSASLSGDIILGDTTTNIFDFAMDEVEINTDGDTRQVLIASINAIPADLIAFTGINAEAILDALRQLSQFLANTGDTDLFAENYPFAQDTLLAQIFGALAPITDDGTTDGNELFGLSGSFERNVIDKLISINDNDTPDIDIDDTEVVEFSTLQEFFSLTDGFTFAPGSDATPAQIYDAATGELRLRFAIDDQFLDLGTQIVADRAFSVDLDLGSLTNLDLNAQLTFDPSIGLNLEIGVDLKPDNAEPEIVIAPSQTGVLTENGVFDIILFDGTNLHTLNVTVNADGTNTGLTGPQNLLEDVQTAVADAITDWNALNPSNLLAADRITVSINEANDGSKLVFKASGSSDRLRLDVVSGTDALGITTSDEHRSNKIVTAENAINTSLENFAGTELNFRVVFHDASGANTLDVALSGLSGNETIANLVALINTELQAVLIANTLDENLLSFQLDGHLLKLVPDAGSDIYLLRLQTLTDTSLTQLGFAASQFAADNNIDEFYLNTTNDSITGAVVTTLNPETGTIIDGSAVYNFLGIDVTSATGAGSFAFDYTVDDIDDDTSDGKTALSELLYPPRTISADSAVDLTDPDLNKGRLADDLAFTVTFANGDGDQIDFLIEAEQTQENNSFNDLLDDINLNLRSLLEANGYWEHMVRVGKDGSDNVIFGLFSADQTAEITFASVDNALTSQLGFIDTQSGDQFGDALLSGAGISGRFDLDIQGEIAGYGNNFDVNIDIDDINKPSQATVGITTDSTQLIEYLDYNAVVQHLQDTSNILGRLPGEIDLFSQAIPLIDVTLNDIGTALGGGISDYLDTLAEYQPNTLQDLDALLQQIFLTDDVSLFSIQSNTLMTELAYSSGNSFSKAFVIDLDNLKALSTSTDPDLADPELLVSTDSSVRHDVNSQTTVNWQSGLDFSDVDLSDGVDLDPTDVNYDEDLAQASANDVAQAFVNSANISVDMGSDQENLGFAINYGADPLEATNGSIFIGDGSDLANYLLEISGLLTPIDYDTIFGLDDLDDLAELTKSVTGEASLSLDLADEMAGSIGTLEISVSDLSAALNGTVGSVEFTSIPTFSEIGQIGNRLDYLLSNPDVLINGIDRVLDDIQTGIEILIEPLADLPLLGDNVFEPFLGLLDDLRETRIELRDRLLSAIGDVDIIDFVQNQLYQAFNDAGILGDYNYDGFITIDDVEIEIGDGGASNVEDEYVQWNAHLGQEKLFDLDISEGLGLGDIPGLELFADFGYGIDSGDGFQLKFDWGLDLGLGISTGDGFYLATDGENEFEASVNLDAKGLTLETPFFDITDGTRERASITAELPFYQFVDNGNFDLREVFDAMMGTGGNRAFDIDLRVTYGNGDIDNISFNNLDLIIGTGGSLPSYLLNTNAFATIGEKFMLSLDLESFIAPKILLSTIDPNIVGIEILTGEDAVYAATEGATANGAWGFVAGQTDAQRKVSVGFADEQTSTGSVGNYVLEAMMDIPALSADPDENAGLLDTVKFDFTFVDATGDIKRITVDLSKIPDGFSIENIEDLRAAIEQSIDAELPGLFPELLEGKTGSERDNIIAQLQDTINVEIVGNKLSLQSTMELTIDNKQHTGVHLSAGFDFQDPSDNGRASLAEIISEGVFGILSPFVALDSSGLNLNFDYNVDALTDGIADLVGIGSDALSLPSVNFDLKLDTSFSWYALGKSFVTNVGSSSSGDDSSSDSSSSTSSTASTSNTSGNVKASLKTAIKDSISYSIVIDNITLDIGGLLDNVVTPIADTILDVLGPINDLVSEHGFLEEDLPLLDELGLDVSLRDILDADPTGILNAFLGAIQSLQTIEDVIANIRADGALYFGGWTLPPEKFVSATGIPVLPVELNNMVKPFFDNEELAKQLMSALGSGAVFSFENSIEPGGLKLDILDPSNILNWILGKPYDIVSFNLPTVDLSLDTSFNLGFGFDEFYLGITLAVGAGLHLDLGLVYDSTGIQRILDAHRVGAEIDPAALLDGFYIRNEPGYEASVRFSIDGSARIGPVETEIWNPFGDNFNFTWFDASLHAYAGVFAGLNIIDPNEDGKLRINEIAVLAEDDPLHLLCLFDADLNVNGGIDAYVELLEIRLGTDDLPFPTNFDLTLNLQDIFGAFGLDCDDLSPHLAEESTIDGEDVLRLNTGPFAHARIVGDTDDSDGPVNYTVTAAGNTVSITAIIGGKTYTQTLTTSLRQIVGYGSDFGDTYDFSGLDSSWSVELYAGAGSDTITGSQGNDVIYGELGNDTLNGNLGSDTLYGGLGEDRLNGDAGNDTLVGGRNNDTLAGGDGNDNYLFSEGTSLLDQQWGSDTVIEELVTVGDLDAGVEDILDLTGIRADLIVTLDQAGTVVTDGTNRINVQYTNGGRVNGHTIEGILGGEGDDRYFISASEQVDGVSTLLNGGEGSDRYEINSSSDLGDLIVQDTGSADDFDLLIINGTVNADIIGLSNSQIVISTVEDEFNTSVIEYDGDGGSGIEAIEIYLKEDNDIVNVESTPSASTVVINGASGNDRFNVGVYATSGKDVIDDLNDGRYNLNEMISDNGTLKINGGDQDDELYVYDSTDTTNNEGDTAGLHVNGMITGLGMSHGIEYNGFESIEIELGTADDDFTVLSTVLPMTIRGNTGDDEIVIGVDSTTVTSNEIAGEITLDGDVGSDHFTLNLAGIGSSTINVLDTGATGSDDLTINATNVADQFLLRREFVALLNANDLVERINYDTHINGLMTINSFEGEDRFNLDDNSAFTEINTGAGNDYIKVGQMFNEARDLTHVASGDEFDTVQTTKGYLSAGVSYETTINGGADNDEFLVMRNTAPLNLNGDGGNDTFIIRAFALEGPGPVQGLSTISGGDEADNIEYSINAPVDVDGGDGLDKVVIIGTEFSDKFVITDSGVFGAGLAVSFANVESLSVHGVEGNDEFYVLSTNADLVTSIYGGLGSDTFNITDDVPAGIEAYDENGDQIVFGDTPQMVDRITGIAGPLYIHGYIDETLDLTIPAPVMLPDESDGAPYVSETDNPHLRAIEEDQTDRMNVYDHDSTLDDTGVLTRNRLTGLGMGDDTSIGGEDFNGGITYGDLEDINITLGSGNDTLTIESTHEGTTQVYAGPGNDTLNIRTIDGDTTVRGEAGNDTFTITHQAPLFDNGLGLVGGITQALNIYGDADSDTMNVDDSGQTLDSDAELTQTTLNMEFMPGVITYGTLEDIHVYTGSGNDLFNVQGTAAGSHTRLYTADGNDIINVSDNAPDLSGTLDDVDGELTVFAGTGGNTLNVSDINSSNGDGEVVITRDRIEGLAEGAINYSAIDGRYAGGVNIWAGTGIDDVLITSTRAGDVTTLWANEGNDNIEVTDDLSDEDGLLIVFGEEGDDVIDASAWNTMMIAFGDLGEVIYGDDRVATYNGSEVIDKKIDNLAAIKSTDYATGGDDVISGGTATDIITGGTGNDTLSGGDGDDYISGDNAEYYYLQPGQSVILNNSKVPHSDDGEPLSLDLMWSIQPTIGGDDLIDGGNGNDYLMGGASNDEIHGGRGDDILFGDDGQIAFENFLPLMFETIIYDDLSYGGDDILAGYYPGLTTDGEDHDYMFGGAGDDLFHGSFGHDVMIGEFGRMTFTYDDAGVAQGLFVIRLGQHHLDLIANRQFGLYNPDYLVSGNTLTGGIIPSGGAAHSPLVGDEIGRYQDRDIFTAHGGQKIGQASVEEFESLIQANPPAAGEEGIEEKINCEAGVPAEGVPAETQEGIECTPVKDGEVPVDPSASTNDTDLASAGSFENIVAGFAGWGIVKAGSGLRNNKKDMLDRDDFELMEKANDKRRFMHWDDSRLQTGKMTAKVRAGM